MTYMFLSNNIAGPVGSLTGSGPFWQCGARTKPAQNAICASTTPTSHKGNPSAKEEIKDTEIPTAPGFQVILLVKAPHVSKHRSI